MVGYYNEAALPPGPEQPSSEEPVLLVKRVVCSPDLPIPGFPSQQHQQPQQLPQQQQLHDEQSSSVRCQLCNKVFTSKSAFQTHQRGHAKETEDPYRCHVCSKTFAVPARLTRHFRTHTGEKPFRCEFCNKSFSVKENLSVHRRIHTKERPYKCEVCSRAFEHSGKLHRHMRIHTGERPHKCTVCSKTFIQSGQLVIHMRTHTGEKPYVCTVCQKGFTCSKQLKVHSRTHTGEKPYSCEICGKSFGYNHVLKLHQVAHYGEKVYKCTICNHTFNSKKCMEAHIKSHSENASSATTATTTPVTPSESSCSSTVSSDKEYHREASSPIQVTSIPEPAIISYDSDISYYYRFSPPSWTCIPQSYNNRPSAGVELLAEAATASEREASENKSPCSSDTAVFSIISKGPPDVMAALRQPTYFTTPAVQYNPDSLKAGDGIRKYVEAALEKIASQDEPILTPPSSNPVSPAPSVSPDPELSLPPRKRSKMIKKSIELAKDLSPVRYSVIQYAGAS